MKPTNILTVLLLALVLAVSASTSALATSNTVETVSVMDLGLNRASTHAYALRPGKTVSNKVPSLGGKSMPDAFGVAGNCVLTYDLTGESHRLSGLIGVDDSVDKTFTGSVELQVYGDNKRLWGSGPLKPGDKPIVLDVALKGVKRLELVQDFSGDHFMAMEIAWANMAITYSSIIKMKHGTKPLQLLLGIVVANWFISSVEWPCRGVSIAPLTWEGRTMNKAKATFGSKDTP